MTARTRRQKPEPYLKDFLLVVVGAVIGLSSSMLTAYTQNKAQREQFLIDKKLQVLRDASNGLNEHSVALDSLLLDLGSQYEEGAKSMSKGIFLSAAEWEALAKKNEIVRREMTTLKTAWSTNRILTFAIFNDEPPDLELEELGPINKRWAEAMKRAESQTPNQQAKTMAPILVEVALQLKTLRKDLIDGTNRANAKLVDLAKQLR